MALKYRVSKADYESLEDSIKSFYTEGRDNNWYLEVEGAAAKDNLEQAKKEAKELQRALEEQKKKFGNVDLDLYEQFASLGLPMDEIKVALEDHKKTRDKQLIEKGEFERIVKEREEAMKRQYQKQLDELNGIVTSQKSQLENLLIDDVVSRAAMEAGVLDDGNAIEMVKLMAKKNIQLKENRPVVVVDGEIRYGQKGDPMSVGEWVNEFAEKTPFLFKKSTGGGSQGAGMDQGGGNPGNARKIKGGDPLVIGRNLEAIASGKIEVV